MPLSNRWRNGKTASRIHALRPGPAPTETIMTNARVTGLRSVELGVPDLARSAAFYQDIWGLPAVASDGDTIPLRGTSAEHHVVTLRRRPKAALLGVHF